MNSIKDTKICVIGLGYVGLPLARLFSTKYPTIGLDMNRQRVDALMAGHDATLEVSDELLQEAIDKHGFRCTADLEEVRDCNFYVVAVPTPVDENNRPDLKPLWGASKTVGEVISKGDVVVYESTVYPGVTEEECLPVVEQVSGLKFNVDFFAGYSPERINPGDKLHTVEKIKKVTSGSTPEVADYVDAIYNSVLVNGTHKAPSIRVAEASKIIENSQRDVNIAFMNELAKIFNAMDIDTHDVIEAASSKWNFIKLSPGLVGGHCISVDPYYLIQKAQVYGVLPRVMYNARRLNDGMGAYVANQTIKCMNKKGVMVKDAKILILGITFKENCPDYYLQGKLPGHPQYEDRGYLPYAGGIHEPDYDLRSLGGSGSREAGIRHRRDERTPQGEIRCRYPGRGAQGVHGPGCPFPCPGERRGL